ncbi:TPM domain-containing protein [Curtobacterium sp. MCBD17_021]|uniref:TPM domain-containing protein n=1 Tax=Curtobacterium sp. MCBD17_021 TaxID=2175665 RepID=UPI000DA6F057|nr:TPM domain-containing protein [Curtobacterium sp. MCBD17_021]PZE65677.1 hypothetical protein DEI83_09075 [Curtobacterium sp. MCBD17_021]
MRTVEVRTDSGSSGVPARDGTARPSRLARLLAGVAATAVAALLVVSPVSAAQANPPVDLAGAYVLDDADALTDAQQADVEQAVQDLYQETQTQLFVVFVPSFTDPSDHTAWGTATMQQNQVETDSILLSVAVDERNYDVQQTNETSITSGDVERAVDGDLLPRLKQGQWAAAAVAFAGGLQQSQQPADLTWLWVLLGVAVLAAVVAVLVIRRRNKGRAAAARREQEQSLAELQRRAGGALVTIDDELRTAEQEVGFAAAQFGDEAAAPFAETVSIAQREVRKAFALQQQLDDEVPDTPQERAEWSNQIIAICEQAHAAIESQTEAFDQLRALEQGVDTASADLTAALTAAPTAVAEARSALERVRTAYRGRTLATVADNVDQAEQVLAYAGERADAARTALAAGDRGEAVVAVRDGQHALAQVQQLTGAVTTAERTFAEASDRAEAMRADIEGDIAAAGALRSGGPDLAAAVARAQRVLRADVDPRDPVGAVDALTKANTDIDAALATARTAEEQHRRATQALDAALRDARSRIGQAREFITVHRGAVGPTARTRLSEAERAFDDALDLATTDPQRALQAARAAEQYAAAAIDEANNDTTGWPGGGMGGMGGGRGGPQLGGLVTGLVLGGLLGGRGGSYGGGSFGGGGFSGGGRF